MPKNRLEAFSDGIIAFAITLLILEIHIPDLGPGVDNAAMLKAILGLWPNFAVYVVSFVICNVWWISHHTFIHDLHSVDRRLLWVNSVFLMLIAFMPFPTGLLGHHPGQPIATAFYGLVCTMTGFAFWLMRWYASTRANLIKPEFPSAAITKACAHLAPQPASVPRRDRTLFILSNNCALSLRSDPGLFCFPKPWPHGVEGC
jgi:uncharacterized membrane protein